VRSVRTAAALPVRRLLDARRPARFAGPGIDDALRAARRSVASGRLVSLEHRAGRPDDDEAELRQLADRVHESGLAPSCELLVQVDRLGVRGASAVTAAARAAGVRVVLSGRPAQVGPLAGDPDVAVLVPADEPGAEERCRALVAGRVRIASGHGVPADLAFVRCLNVLMTGGAYVAVGTGDPRLVAIAGERAAWNGRAAASWEYVLPCGVREEEQQRLVAGGYRVRVSLPSGTGNAPLAAGRRRLGG
jgi:proline dehydrogenase